MCHLLLTWITTWIFYHAQPISLAWTDPRFWKCNANCIKYKLTGFRINFFQKRFLCPLFCVCFFITVGLWTVARQLAAQASHQLVGTTGFSWAKVYNKSGRAPGHLLLPNEFQKRLKSRLLIGQKNNQRRGTVGRLSCLLTRGCFPHRTP